MAFRNIFRLLCFALTLVHVFSYVYRPGKRDTRFYTRKQLSIFRRFIKEIHSIQSRKRFERLLKIGSNAEKAFLSGILEHSFNEDKTAAKIDKKERGIHRIINGEFNEIGILLLRRVLLDNGYHLVSSK